MWGKTLRAILLVAIITWTANALTNDIENIELKGPRTINKEFSESQGNKTGEPKYSLKNEAEWYNFQMKNDNPWVTVNLNGDIKVRKTWNYSELGPDKTIDFFVECKNRKTLENGVFHLIFKITVNPLRFLNEPQPMQTVIPLFALSQPNYPVYTFRTINSEPNTAITYKKNTRKGHGDKFTVNEKSGDVFINGSQDFQKGDEYKIYVEAEIKNINHTQSSGEQSLSIIIGNRPPQFYQEKYETIVPEDKKKNSDIITIKAISFTKSQEIKYDLKSRNPKSDGFFTINPETGVVKLDKELDYEDINQLKEHLLHITATDNTGLSTTVDLLIITIDVNDNLPIFDLPDYQVTKINEDIEINTNILNVTIKDADSGDNTAVEYSVSDEHFYVDSIGKIYTKKLLDADYNKALYEFNIKATNILKPYFSTSSTVRVTTKNINDETPQFSKANFSSNVDENVKAGTLVTTIIASDADNDVVYYSFDNGELISGPFEIDNKTGIVRLNKNHKSFDRDEYIINVTAFDDGKKISHKNTTLLIVSITDMNDNRPVFDNCSLYAPTVEENKHKNTPVMIIKATDKDKGLNAMVKYTLVQNKETHLPKFNINETTGEVFTNEIFDREKSKTVPMTVKATDLGKFPLEGICSFTVTITDVNDNQPFFEREKYDETVLRPTDKIGSKVLKMFASDFDADKNGAIIYTIVEGKDSNYFNIHPDSGWITLKKPFDSNKKKYELVVEASDKGEIPLTTKKDVVLRVITEGLDRPHWISSENETINIEESRQINTLIHTMIATSGIKDKHELTFIMILNGPPFDINYKNPFKLEKRNDLNVDNSTTVDIFLNYNLDYESTTNYSFKIEVTNDNKLKSSATLLINVIDTNDEPPEIIFDRTEIVAENQPIGTYVGTIQSIDSDVTPPYNIVTYNFSRPADNEYFRIENKTGEIFTKKIFDREDLVNSYVLKVTAVDGALSTRPNTAGPNTVSKDIRIEISDINDNSPSFEKSHYNASIDENEDDKNKIIVQVIAKDADESSVIQYSIIDGNYGGSFTVDQDTGAIYVSGTIDYEKINQYELIVKASDSLYSDTTKVTINVRDLNDNSPVFKKSIYSVNIAEEDDKNLPKSILIVEATDDDKQRPINMTYFLHDQDTFIINQTTGEISVTKPLDRDNGHPQIKFIVHAQDEEGDQGRIGVAEVWVNLKDINDNRPVFPEDIYHGHVEENSGIGTEIITVNAIDRDEGNNAKITYSITKDVFDGKLFEIDSTSGLIKTAVCCLDRERKSDYKIEVIAKDGGGLTGTTSALIQVTDVNDNAPKFTKDEWFVKIPETSTNRLPKSSFLTVTVEDKDDKDTNNFYYKILEHSGFGSDKFSIIRDNNGMASLKIIQPLDYEDPAQKKGFRFKIQVSDKGENNKDVNHLAYSWVNIELLDKNDNKPQFENSNIYINISEDTELETVIANFSATDIDNDGNSKINYEIDRRSYFKIDNNGTVRVSHNLDREEISTHKIQVLAIDDGIPAMTSTATLTVVLEDINDNAPRLKNPVAVLNENSSPHKFAIISAIDDDDHTKGNGPPFKYFMDPNASDDIKTSFQVNYPDSDEGTASVSSLIKFDREKQKKYYVPIVITDSGTPTMTGTSTLTVIIGDMDDNEIFPGTNEILVYNYNGKIPATDIGRVYVDDTDDWDVQNKKFSWNVTHLHNSQFELGDNGVIKMKSNTNDSVYQLYFNVEDIQRKKIVLANVYVTVKTISREAVINSGSLRISGLLPEDFIRTQQDKNRFDVFKRKLSKFLDISEDFIDIFSVQQHQEDPPQTDIRFSAKNPNNVTCEKLQNNPYYHGMLYYQPILLNDIILKNREEFERDVVINIVMVGIDECLDDNKQFDIGCTNKLEISNIPYTISANTTGLVGVRVDVTKEYTCAARNFNDKDTCATKHCYNGGKCIEDYYGAKCECETGYDGPRCQLTTRSFKGNGWAWYPALEICDNSHLSFEFITEKLNGQLIYNGPVAPPKSDKTETTDFISVELINGFPKLLINLGTKIISVVIPNIDKSLNDGEWHRLDIIWNRFTVELIVDLCKNEKIYEKNNSINSNSTCHAIADVPLYNEYLNVNGPLQIGGLNIMKIDQFNWETKPGGIGFNGCIKNIIHNSKLYDLGFPGYEHKSWPGCPQTEYICNKFIPKCWEHGSCVGSLTKAKCHCLPGWFGSECDKQTIPVTFNNQSFVKYSLSFFIDDYAAEIQLQFRTRESNGELFRVSDKFNTNEEFAKFAILEIKDSKVLFRYNLNNEIEDERKIMLSTIDVNDGQWHTVRVSRYGSAVILELDGGEGRRYNETILFEGPQRLDVDKDEGIYAGGRNKFSGVNTFEDDGGYHNGCLNDIRLSDVYLPLSSAINGTQISKVDINNIVNECFSKEQCQTNASCSKPYHCVDIWNSHDCTCGDGKKLFANDTTCVDKDECLDFPCLNDGICININSPEKYQCKCLDNFFGYNCQFTDGIVLFESYSLIMMNWSGLLVNVICLVVLFLLIFLTRIERKTVKVYHNTPQETDQLIVNAAVPDKLPSKFPGWINGKKQGADENINLISSPVDDTRNYNYEGDGNSIITLSTISADNEPDELRSIGPLDPRFGLLGELFDSEDNENDDDKNQQNHDNSKISGEFLWN